MRKYLKKYLVTIYNGNNKVCCTHEQANTADEACVGAEFALVCRYANVEFTHSIAEEIKEV